MPFKPTTVVLAIVLLLTGCDNDSPGSQAANTPKDPEAPAAAQTSAKSDTVLADTAPSEIVQNAVSEDWSYKRVCIRFQNDQEQMDDCLASSTFRANLANSQADTMSLIKYEQIKDYGQAILESNLDAEITDEAENRLLDQIPVELAGLELGVLPGLPDYFKVEGGIFGYRSEVGLSAVIIGRGTEVTVSVDEMSEKQQEFLENVCGAELNWQDSTCQGDIYVAVAEGDQFVELILVGAKLMEMSREKLKEIELRKLW